jgi:glycerol kinase
MQFQADILQARVIKPEITEVTAIGAAYLAGLAIGFWQNIDEIQEQWQINKSFEPDAGLDTQPLIHNWHRAVKAAKAWSDLNAEFAAVPG